MPAPGRTILSAQLSYCIRGISNLQVCDVEIDQLCRHIIEQRVLHIHLLHQIPIFVTKYLARIAVLDQTLKIERVNRAELVNACDYDNRCAMHPRCLGYGFCPCSGDETTVRKDDMCTEDDLVDAGHQREDSGIGDHDDGDAGGG